jgi:hypothetical protein
MKFITDLRIITGKHYFTLEVKTVEAEIKKTDQGQESEELVITAEESPWTKVQIIPDMEGRITSYN